MQKDVKKQLTGVFPPITTPFNNQKVDYPKLKANIEKMNQTKIKGYMPLGSNGEFISLTDDEAVKVVDTIYKSKTSDKTLIVGAGKGSAFATVEFIKKIADKGADFASILAPYYYVDKMTDAALVKYFESVADNSPIPIMLYCIPKYSAGVTISFKCVAQVAYHDNIIGLKDSSKHDIVGYIMAVPKGVDFYILSGSITKFYKGLQKGAIGGVLSMANYLPDYCCEIQELYNAKNYEKAEELSDWLCDLNKNISGKYGVSG